MIGISKLYLGKKEPSDHLRYEVAGNTRKPVVVFNSTRACNLQCRHCYSQSSLARNKEELTTKEALALIEDIAKFDCPVLLFSGGEPLMRQDLFDLIRAGKERGLRIVISTNGTLISPSMAERLRETEVAYVGVSIDGIGEINDKFRGIDGAFNMALRGIRNLLSKSVRVGIRFTINRWNYREVPKIFDLAVEEGIPRICFYHLVYTGRGEALKDEELSHEEKRRVVDLIIDKTEEVNQQGKGVEVLTVDNHADGIYLYQRMKREGSPRAQEVLNLLRLNQGNSSGIGIACVSWDGEVYMDQFFRSHSFGNIRKQPFSEIWSDSSNSLLSQLRNRTCYLEGRCKICKYLDICGGNLRARAFALTGSLWASDPACYLTDAEITQEEEK